MHSPPPSNRLTPTTQAGATPPKKTSSQRLRDVWPDIREMIRSRRGILAAGFGLMVINRICGLVLPGSTKFLVDDVLGKRQYQLLVWIVLAAATATIIQGFTSFSLTQLVSKDAQRLIVELRR